MLERVVRAVGFMAFCGGRVWLPTNSCVRPIFPIFLFLCAGGLGGRSVAVAMAILVSFFSEAGAFVPDIAVEQNPDWSDLQLKLHRRGLDHHPFPAFCYYNTLLDGVPTCLRRSLYESPVDSLAHATACEFVISQSCARFLAERR